MNKLLMITVGILLFLTTSCDSGGDENGCGDFNGNWIGETVTTTWSDDACGYDLVIPIDCYEVTFSNNTAVFDFCSCDWADPNEECIDEEEINCNDSDDSDDLDCEVNGDVLTCTSSEEDDDCIQTTTIILVRD